MWGVDEAPAFWDAGSEHGHQVVALGFALALTATAINLALVGRLTMFFDLAFITLSLTLAVVVRRQDFFVVALLPPLLMIAVFAFLALVAREAIADPATPGAKPCAKSSGSSASQRYCRLWSPA